MKIISSIACVSFLTLVAEAQGVTDLSISNPFTTRCLTPGEFDPNLDYFDGFKFVATDYSGPPLLSTDGEQDLFPDKVEVDTTTDLFKISYHNHYKIITNHFVNQTYLLYLCGTLEEVPVEELQDGKHHLILSVPHTGKVAVTETPQIPFLELLGLRREIIAYVGDPQWVSSPCLNYMIDQEKSVEVVLDADDPYNTSSNTVVRNQFIDDNPDILIFGGPYFDKDTARQVIFANTLERTTVATFDWIGFVAAFFNLEAMSNQIVADTKARFDCASANAAHLSADRSMDERPLVLWASYFDGYNWSIAECPTWDAAYYCEYAAHCGATIISRPEGFGWNDPDFGGTYWYLDDDQLLELGKNADHFIYPGNWTAVYEEKKEILDQIKAVQNGQVFDTSGKGSTSWYEQRYAEYEVVALDFCDMVGTASHSIPEGANNAYERQWLRNVLTDPTTGGFLEDKCNAPDQIDEPLVVEGAACVRFDAAPQSDSGVGSGGGTAIAFAIVVFTASVVHVLQALAL